MTDVAFVIFFIINIVQIITIISILIYAVTDVYRRCNSPSLSVRSERLITNGGNKNVAFVGGGAPEETVFKFRKLLKPEKMEKVFLGGNTKKNTKEEKPEKKKKPSILSLLKRGHEPKKGEGVFISSSKYDDDILFERMGKDPLVFMSAVTSKFVREYSPFHAKVFKTKSQLNNKLVYPQPIKRGTAFVLPTGHVINKAVQMTVEDLHTWNPPPNNNNNSDRYLTTSCAAADPVHRINVYGFAGSQNNKRARQTSTVEMLVCNCPVHKNLLEAPDPASYSSNPDHIQVDVDGQRVLFPGPGTEPLRSLHQFTAAAADGS